MSRRVVLYGATGHTGRFIAAEMVRRGWSPVLAGRSADALAALAAEHGVEARAVQVDDAVALDRLLVAADAIINAAGPFGDTSPHLIEAALRAGIPYFDVTAEPFVAKEMFETYADRATQANVIVAPAFGFFGAIGDLLVTAAKADWDSVDRVELAFALDRWRPTKGTRAAGARRAGRRLVLTDDKLEVRDPSQAVPKASWRFGPPFGDQPVIGEFSTVDVVTVARHVPATSIGTWINEAPLTDLASEDASGPEATDESGRSAQEFQIEVVVHKGSEMRRAQSSGRDIYAITAPLVCEAVEWTLSGRAKTSGMVCAGELFDAPAFLKAMSRNHLNTHLQQELAA
jgi:NAD(P)-dependent dehydrogenase (short-subunit alcohol dehydrogenase family)